MHRVIRSNQEAWLKTYIDINTRLSKEGKNEFEKNFFQLMNNSVFRKTIENVRNHRDVRLVASEERKVKLVSEPNYHTSKHFSENLIAIDVKKANLKMNQPIYLGVPLLGMIKKLMYEFWYDYLKPKYNDNVKLC